MFSKLAFALTALLAAATAMPTGGSGGGSGTSQCNTGSPQCCQSTTTAKDPAFSALAALLGVNVEDLDVPVGLTCSPLSVIGVGDGSSCDQSPVCCNDIYGKGLIAVNCIPINISL